MDYMDLAKKNIVSILCGVVAIICVIAVFFPFSGMFAGLQEQLTGAKKIGDEIQQTRNTPRNWPTLSAREEDRVPLSGFPTENTYRVGSTMTQGWTNQSGNFLTNVLSLQERTLKLLVPNSLPDTRAKTFEFVDTYRERFGLKTDVNGRPELERSIYRTVLNGGLPPSTEEVKAQQDQVAEQTRQRVERTTGGQVQNAEEVTQAVAEATSRVAETMRNERGRSFGVYVDPVTALTPHPRIGGNVAPVPADIFNAQVMLWVQEDLCRGIREVNANAKQGVMDAPFKRLIKLNVTSPYHGMPAPAGAPPEAPALPPAPTAKLTMNYADNALGHVSNDFYDVVKFDISFVCEADTLPQTLEGLTANRLAMFRDVRLESLDGNVAAAQGFLYGSKPVMQVSAKGQYLLLRRFVGPFMPPDIIRGLTAPTTATPGMPGMEGMPGGAEGMGMPGM